jgi:hypothetical protein
MAGSIAATVTDIGGGITKYSLAWTSDASGNVNANPIALKRGRIQQVKFVPTNGGVQPSANYNVTLPDADGVDLLAGKGATLSNTTATLAIPVVSAVIAGFVEPQAAINLTVTAAGVTTNGRVDLFIG